MRQCCLFFLITLLIILVFACVKSDDAIAATCFAQEYASFSVDDEEQSIGENSIGGVNLNYLFGAKPNGEWSMALESEAFLLSISHSELISTDAYQKMSKEEWLFFMQSQDSVSLVDNPHVQQLFVQDMANEQLFELNHLSEGYYGLRYVEQTDGCAFLELNLALQVLRDTSALNVSASLFVAMPLKKG